MPCHGDKHVDLYFVYQLPDIVCTDVVYDDTGKPTVTETRQLLFECRLCYKPIYGEPHTTTYQPDPSEIIYEHGRPVQYRYDV